MKLKGLLLIIMISFCSVSIANPPEKITKAAEKGDSTAQNTLGKLYFFGKDGAIQDYEKAAFWFQKAADQGNLHASANLGNMLLGGYKVKQDFSKAVKYLKAAADSGNPAALNNLGYAYANGLGVETDNRQAIKYYQDAANAGFNVANYNAGLLFLKENLPKQAFDAFLKSAEAGLPRGMRMVGVMTRMGVGTAKNGLIACQWLKKATELKDSVASDQYKELIPELSAEDKKQCGVKE